MKKQLHFSFSNSFSRAKSFRMAAFAALTLLSAQSSFAQTWVGATSTDFLDTTNWSAAPTYTNTDVFLINAVVAPNFNPTFNVAATCSNITTKVGSVLTTTADFTTGSLVTSIIEGTVNINGGIWSSPKLYIGSASGGAGVVNVAGATLTGSGVWRLGSTNNSGTHYLNINNGGILDMNATSSLTIGFTSSRKGVLNVNTGGVAKIFGGLSISSTLANGTINIAGGSLEYNPVNFDTNSGVINITAGSFKLLNTTGINTINANSTTANGVINIGGGSLDVSGPLTIGHGATTTANVTINLNSGTMNVAGAFAISNPTGTYTGLINIDGGSIVLDGDQTATVATLVTAGRITVSGAALAAGKTISNTFDAGTNKTTVVASGALGVNEKATDVNSIVVYSQGQSIKVNSENTLIADVNVYDITGHLIESKKNIQSKETSLDLNTLNQIVVVKVTTSNGTILSRKIIN